MILSGMDQRRSGASRVAMQPVPNKHIGDEVSLWQLYLLNYDLHWDTQALEDPDLMPGNICEASTETNTCMTGRPLAPQIGAH